MLMHWLKTADDPPPSWEAVVTALRSPLVNERNVAAQLESKYCTPKREESTSSIKMEKGEGIVVGYFVQPRIHPLLLFSHPLAFYIIVRQITTLVYESYTKFTC